MKQDPAADFADTQPNAAAAKAIEPLHPSWLTRVLYCLALLALVLSSLGQASGWIGLATGGGLIGWAGSSVFLVVFAALAYRVYRVLRDRSALDARPPNVFGHLLRGLGSLLMLAGAVGGVSMFLVRPLTLMIFKTGGEAGVAFFVVGLYAALLASVGWIGCLLFEASRFLGERVTAPAPPRSRRQRLQDGGVFAGLVLLALAWPALDRLTGGEGCLGKTLGACAAKVDGGVTRLAMVPVGAPVVLQSNLEAIEYRHSGGRDWTVTERPVVSLLKSGHPAAAQGSHADVRVIVDVAESGDGVLVTLLVTELGQETASFATRFKSGASLQPGANGQRKLVIELPRNVQPPFGARKDELLDEVYRQMRVAIGSEREVAEARLQVKQPATLVSSTPIADPPKIEDARPASSCSGILKFEPGKAETGVAPFPGDFLPQLVFVQEAAPGASVLLHGNDRIGCHGGAVWAADDRRLDRQLRIRKYDMAGALQRHILVDMPERKTNEFPFVDEGSFAERNGQLEFDLVSHDRSFHYTRERFSTRL